MGGKITINLKELH